MQQTKKLIMAKQAMTQSASWLQSTPVHLVSQMQTPTSSQTSWRLQILVTVGPPGQSMERYFVWSSRSGAGPERPREHTCLGPAVGFQVRQAAVVTDLIEICEAHALLEADTSGLQEAGTGQPAIQASVALLANASCGIIQLVGIDAARSSP